MNCGNPLDGLRHQAVQQTRSGLTPLTLLQDKARHPSSDHTTHLPTPRDAASRSERTPPTALTRDLHAPQPFPGGWGAPRGQRRGQTSGALPAPWAHPLRGSAPCPPWRPRPSDQIPEPDPEVTSSSRAWVWGLVCSLRLNPSGCILLRMCRQWWFSRSYFTTKIHLYFWY